MDDIDAMTAAPPTNAIAAVTHRNPYPYYRNLARGGPIQFDPELHAWLVTGHATISTVLSDSSARTRPLTEPIPAALAGTETGSVFGRLVRMTDDRHSRAVKGALQRALAELPPDQIAALTDRIASDVLDRAEATGDPDWPARALFEIPVTTIATLLGLPRPALADLTGTVRRFAAALAPAPFTGSVAESDSATGDLIVQVRDLVERSPETGTPLMRSLVQLVRPLGPDWREMVIANAIGLLFQSLDATAGLIGNSLRALAADPTLRAAVRDDPTRIGAVVRETLRHDPPVQNTRRFIATRTTVQGMNLDPGETLLLILATANRDPAVFPDPDQFDPRRTGREALSFGVGAHRCPGQRLAWEIAVAGVRHGLRHGLSDGEATSRLGFVPSPNARIPLLTAPDNGSWRQARQPFPSIPIRRRR